MQPDSRDMARLWDMLDSARAILDFIKERTLDDLLTNRMLRNAIERNLEILGEAARNVSSEMRSSNPEISWTSVIGLRNVITHKYGEIRYEKIWSICTNRLPTLVDQLEKTGVDRPPEN
jgi:uncharacterized protein with HEPN domain